MSPLAAPLADAAPPAPEALGTRTAQLWIEPISDDPESLSALAVARRALEAARELRQLRRVRLIEMRGALPGERELLEWVHRSTRFYNPHKERCRLRAHPELPAPLAEGEAAVLVFDRDGERRAAAERWWRHATGRAATVKEGVAWIASATPGVDPRAVIEALTVVRDRRHGLLCNPHAQEWRGAGEQVPLPWFTAPARTGGRPRRRS